MRYTIADLSLGVTMTILYIEDEDLGAANALAGKGATRETIIKFTADLRLSTTEITLAAHSSEGAATVGGRTPPQLAADFSTMFTGKNKTDLKHLYLISCEAGVSFEGSPSYAQQLACEMQRLGFAALCVHAVAPPVDQSFVGMRVEVVTRGGLSGHTPGHVNAYLYKNAFSESLDDAITKLSERLDFLKVKVSPLTAAEAREKATKQQDLTTLLGTRNRSDLYKKVDIFSVENNNYKDTMQQAFNTFTGAGLKAPISDAVAFAIMELQQVRRKIDEFFPDATATQRAKYLAHIEEDISKLQAHPVQTVSEISATLKTGRTDWQRWRSTYYGIVITTLESRLRENEMARRTPISLAEVVFSPVHFRRTAGGPLRQTHAPQEELNVVMKRSSLIDKLTNYIEERKNEWNFHFNFLGIMSALYFLFDSITGSDHFNSKSREVKMKAARELLSSVTTGRSPVFEPAESAALQEGRLGALVTENGGLESIANLNEVKDPKPTRSIFTR